MNERSVGAVVVLDADRLVGIVTERDVLRAVATGGVDGPVSGTMTSSPETVEPDESAGQAAVLMIHGGFRHLPVVSDGAVVGMISIRDLVRLTVEDEAHAARSGREPSGRVGHAASRRLLRPDPDVDRPGQHRLVASARALAHHPVEGAPDIRALLVVQVGDDVTRDRVAVDHPVPELRPGRERRDAPPRARCGRREPRLVEPLAQSFRIRDLELEWRWLVGQAGKTRTTDWTAPRKKPRKSICVGGPYAIISTRPPRFVTRTISASARGRSGKSITPNCDAVEVESVVLQLQLVPVHHARLDIEAFG